MSTFKNVTETDLEVSVDGLRVSVAAGGTFKVADEFDPRLTDQPSFELVKPIKSDPERVSVTEEKK